MSKRFYKTIVQIEILSEVYDNDPEPDFDSMNLTDIGYEITDGGSSGVKEVVSQEEVSAKQMAMFLEDQGSDPEFFGIDTDGNEIEDE